MKIKTPTHNKLFVLFISVLSSVTSVYASDFSVNPSKVEHHLFKSQEVLAATNGMVKVAGIKYIQRSESYSNNGRKFEVPKEVYDRAYKLSQSVFKVKFSQRERNSDGDMMDVKYNGTAFYVGGKFVLTNQHVLSPDRSNTTQCKDFAIELPKTQKRKILKCKKVHYCHKTLDFCLIEMKDHRRGYSVSRQKALKLKRNYEYDKDMRTTVIGNPMGYGIHTSTGIGTEPSGQVSQFMPRFSFYASLFGGNSGGPVLNDDNEVIGIAVTQGVKLDDRGRRILVHDSLSNKAIPMETVLNVLENNVSEEIMDQLDY